VCYERQTSRSGTFLLLSANGSFLQSRRKPRRRRHQERVGDVTGLQNHLCGPRDKASAQFLDFLELAENFTLLDRKLIRALNADVVGL
jgi:hypothetical protein